MKARLEKVVYEVLRTIRTFESGFTSTKRNTVDPAERVYSVAQFVECRLNYELFKLEEFRTLEEFMDGHLFEVINITDEYERHYDIITLKFGQKPNILCLEMYVMIKDQLIDLIGGDMITFGSDKRDPSIKVYKNGNEVEIPLDDSDDFISSFFDDDEDPIEDDES